MQNFEQNIASFSTQQLNALQPTKMWPPILYHYTSTDAMLSILQSGKLRASCIEQLNDKVELRYAVSIFRAHLERFYATEQTTEGCDLFRHIRQQVDTVDTTGVYVASFSADGGEFGMWRLYGDRGRGFCFGFPLYKVEHWGGFPGKCHYDTTKADEFCRGALTMVRDTLLADVRAGTKLDLESIATTFLWQISYFGLLFKPHAWADEKEWRLIFTNRKTEIKTRSNGSTYIEIPSDDRLPIGAICAGPMCEQSSINKVQDCLQRLGLKISLHLATAGKLKC